MVEHIYGVTLSIKTLNIIITINSLQKSLPAMLLDIYISSFSVNFEMSLHVKLVYRSDLFKAHTNLTKFLEMLS